MPPPLLAAAIPAAASLIGTGMDAIFTGRMNRKSRNFSREMYQRQYDDNLRLWHMQNEYNSPEQQMQRLKAAGLNPHLIYGGSSGGAAGQASSLDAPSAMSARFDKPDTSGLSRAGDSIMNYFAIQTQAAQLDNLEAQRKVLEQDALLRSAQTASTLQGTERSIFDLGLESELRDYSLEARKLAVEGLKQTMSLNTNRDAREAAANASNIKEAAERMLNLTEQRASMRLSQQKDAAEIQRIKADTRRITENIYLMEREGVLKELEIGLRKQGINPNDAVWVRIVGQLLTTTIDNARGFLQRLGIR